MAADDKELMVFGRKLVSVAERLRGTTGNLDEFESILASSSSRDTEFPRRIVGHSTKIFKRVAVACRIDKSRALFAFQL